MGVHENIDYNKFPAQGRFLGRRCWVCFNYNVDKMIGGTLVRDDRESPGVTIIKLDDGRYVLGMECQFSCMD